MFDCHYSCLRTTSPRSLDEDRSISREFIAQSTLRRSTVPRDGGDLLHAAEAGSFEEVVEILEAGVSVDYQDCEGRSALMFAAMHNHAIVVLELLKMKANVDLPTKHGASALGLACWRGSEETMLILLDARANLEGVMEGGKSALMWAAEANSAKSVNILLERRSDVCYQCVQGNTALKLAARDAHTEIVKILARYGLPCQNSGSATRAAVKNGNTDTVIALLEAGQEPDAVDHSTSGRNSGTGHGVTLLMWAAVKGHLEIARSLIDAKADLNASTDDGDSAATYAAEKEHIDVVRLLLQRGASTATFFSQLQFGCKLRASSIVVSVALAEARGVSKQAKARSLTPRDLATIILVGGRAGPRLLEGLCTWHDAHREGGRSIDVISSCYMSIFVHTTRGLEMTPDQTAIVPKKMINTFVPQKSQSWFPSLCHDTLAQIRFMRCAYPDICNIDVVHGLAKTPNDMVFTTPLCYAILANLMKDLMPIYMLHLASKVLLTTLLLHVTFTATSTPNATICELVSPCTVLICILWMIDFLNVLIEAARRWRGNFGRIALKGCLYHIITLHIIVNVVLSSRECDVAISSALRFEYAVVSVVEWLALLRDLTLFRAIGPGVLPIINTIREIEGFTLVMMIIVVACIQAYLLLAGCPASLENAKWWEPYLDGVFRIWRLAFLGDFNLDEFENGHSSVSGLVTMDLLFLLMSLLVTVVLMNIFIGVVSYKYAEALVQSEVLFLRNRAKMLRSHMLGGMNFLLRYFWPDPETLGELWACIDVALLDKLPKFEE